MSKANDLGSLVNDADLIARNAATLEGQNGAFYRARANHTGTQTLATISDAGTAAALDLVESFATISMAGKGDFTGGTLYLYKIGRQVTLTWTSLSHANSVTAVAVGVIPVSYRPVVDTENAYKLGTSIGSSSLISAAGNFTTSYIDNVTETFRSTTSTGQGSITYISAT